MTTITGDMAEAEDLLQMALERTYRRWHRVRQKDVPEAYVRRILFTSAVDTARGRRLSSGPLQEEQLPGEPDLAIEGLSGRAALLNCVRALPAGQRAVLVLRYSEDLTEAETARTLGCSVGTVKSQHARRPASPPRPWRPSTTRSLRSRSAAATCTCSVARTRC